ncbi:hypothetical protein KC345_g11835 [Hortaea werneckii]|nr:hypothetical protein KC345_g11835 [Hortaea werneckii]
MGQKDGEVGFAAADVSGGGDAGKDDPSFEDREGEGEAAVEAGRVGRGVAGWLGHEEKIEMEMARLLLSKSRWKREVMERFVCMRWKEKCFVRNFPSRSSASSRKSGKTGSEGTDDAGRSKEDDDGIQNSVHPPDRGGSADVEPDHEEDVGVDSAQDDDHQQQGHGLTISGFYYIVLDRQTGGVEGLYYDPASTPFQRLKLRGCSSSSSRSRRPSSSGRGGGGGSSARNGGAGGVGGGGGMVWPAVGFA